MPAMPAIPLPLGTQSYRSDARPLSSQRVKNMYAERQAQGVKQAIPLLGAPGIVEHVTLGTGPIRGAHVMAGVPYLVSGGDLYKLNSDATGTLLGGTVSGTGPVSMDDNATEVQITNGTNGYVYSATSGFQRITSANFHAANTTTFLDGFFVNDRALTNEFFISDSYAGTSYSDLFASAETQSDNVKAVLNHLQLLLVAGDDSIEFWANVGAPNFPFRRQPGAVIKVGWASPYGFGVEDNTVHFIGRDRIAYRLNGTKPEKISTPAIDSAWQKLSTMSDVSAFAYTFEGHKFIVFNIPASNETWVWDISSGLWHERGSRDANNVDLGRWRANCAFNAYDKTFVGDFFSGKIGYLDRTVFTEFGCQIVGEVITPPIHANGKLVTMPWLEVDMETGVGATSGQGAEPQVMISISDDGGRTWGDAEMWSSMGALGNYQSQVRFGPLGSFYERSIKLVVSDPVRRTIMAARCPDMYSGL